MAFLLQNLIPVSAGQQIDANRLWWYSNTEDTVATIKASGYFNTATQFLNQNDVLFIVGSDEKQMIEVTSASQASTVTTIEYTGSSGSISLAEGNMLVGNSSGVGAAVDMSTDGQILVGDGTTVNSVAMSGDATLDNAGALTIAAGAVEQSMISANSLDATVVKNSTDADIFGALPILFRIDTAGGATADTDVTMNFTVRVIDVWVANRAAGTTSDTITVKNGANAITDAIDISGGDKTIARAGELDDANWNITAAGILRVTETDGGGSDSPATTVFVKAVRVV